MAVIELNGKRYDATTGKLLGSSSAHLAQHSSVGKAIDGFVTTPRPEPAKTHHAPPKPVVTRAHTAKPAHAHHKSMDIHRTAAQHAAVHHPERAKTFMRHAVARPKASFKRHAHTATHTGALVKAPHFDIMPKSSVLSVDEARLKRARRIAKSGLISRFGNLLSQAQAPVATTPEPSYRPEPIPPDDRPKPQTVKQPSTDIFERAMMHATSHQEPPFSHKHTAKKPRRGRHITSIAASSLAIILIVGFIAYQNAASIQMHVASSRAGINARLPGWHPNGYSAAKFTYSAGAVAVSFEDPTSSRHFDLTQAASSWDNQTLLSDFVISRAPSYDTIQSGNHTIYTYGNNNATWVSSGIWYQLTTNGALSTSQVVRLASSM